MDILNSYGLSILGVTLLACALAIIGVHLAARSRTLQTLSVSQGAELGSLAAVLYLLSVGHHIEDVPVLFGIFGAIVGAFFCGSLTKLVSRVRSSSRPTALFSFWIFLVCVSHLIVSLHPLLENHFSRIFLGDITTLTNIESILTGAFGLCSMIFLFFRSRTMLRSSFDLSVFKKLNRRFSWEDVFFIVVCSFSTWAAGFLFTCVCLFLPTVLFSISNQLTGLRHILMCFLVALVAVPAGFIFSLTTVPWPTVPLIALFVFGLSLCSILLFLFLPRLPFLRDRLLIS